MGVVTPAVRATGIHRNTHYYWMNHDPEYAAEVRALKDVALDFSEAALFNRIQDGSDACLIFHLKTQGKHRGYIERTEVVAQDKLQEQFGELTDAQLDEMMKQRLSKLQGLGDEIED